MSRSISHVKQEIRILGLDVCNPRFTIGAVIRGGRFLDGVIAYPGPRVMSTSDLARKISRTKYFPELRAIMLHGLGDRLNSTLMQRTTRLPVIEVSVTKPTSDRSYRVFLENQKQLWIKTGIRTSILRRILSVTLTTGRLPEPLRVAHLLAGLSGLGKSLQDKE